MAVPMSNLRIAYSSRATEEILKGTVALNLVNRNWESEVQSGLGTLIPQFEIGTTADITDYTRGSNWKTLQDVTVSQQQFNLDKHSEWGHKVNYLDETETTLSLVDNQARSDSYIAGQYVDEYIWDTIVAGVSSANTLEAYVANDLTSESAITNNTVQNSVFNTVKELINSLVEANLMGPSAMGGVPPVIVMHTTPFLAFLEALERRDLNIGELNAQMFVSAAIGGAMPWGGRYRNVNIISHANFSTITRDVSGTATTFFPIVALTTDFCTYASRPVTAQLLTPGTNQTSPDYAIRGILDHKAQVVDPNRAYMKQIKTA